MAISLRLASILLLGHAALPTVASAQNTEQRAGVAAWEARVNAVADPDELTRLLATPNPSDRDKTAALLHRVRRGFTQSRLGAITHNRRYYDDALESFWSVLLEKYRWPYAWYGLGVTKLAMARERLVPYEATHQPPGSTYRDEAMEALRRALESDEKFTPAAAALERAERAADEAPIGRDSSLVLLDQAKASLAAGRAGEGVAAYRAAVARARSPEARARLRADLAWIADSAELHAFDATRPAELPAWLDAFWERRDVRDVRRPGERLAEHYRRLQYAEQHFARLGSNISSLRFERVSREDRTLDDRAVIYIRHGEPQRRASFGSPLKSVENLAPQEDGIPQGRYPTPRPSDGLDPVSPNLSWKYQRPEGDLIFHFVAHQGSDYRLIESLLDVFPVDTVIELQMGRQTQAGEVAGPAWEWARFARSLVSSRADFDPLYTRLANSFTIQGSSNLQRERATGQESLQIGTTTDSYREVFAVALDPDIQAYGLSRGEAGRVLLVIAVPAKGTEAATLAVRAVVSTREDQRLAQMDTVLHLVPSGEAGVQAGIVELPAPEGTHRVRVVAVDAARQAAGAATIDEVVVPERAGPPTLSDLVLGERAGLSWQGPDGAVWLDADGVFASGGTAQLYYQAAGLSPGATYRTRIELHRSGDGEHIRRLTSEFDVVAASASQAERRELSLGGLRKGEYVLRLSLSGPGGRVTRSRTVRLR